VAHLVSAQDAQHGRTIDERLPPVGPPQRPDDLEESGVFEARKPRPRPEVGRKRGIMLEADRRRRGDRQEKQQEMKPPPVLEPAIGRR